MSKGWRWQGCESSAFLWRDDEIAGETEMVDTLMGEMWVWNVQFGDESASGASTTRDRAIRDLRAWLATRGVETPEVGNEG